MNGQRPSGIVGVMTTATKIPAAGSGAPAAGRIRVAWVAAHAPAAGVPIPLVLDDYREQHAVNATGGTRLPGDTRERSRWDIIPRVIAPAGRGSRNAAGPRWSDERHHRLCFRCGWRARPKRRS